MVTTNNTITWTAIVRGADTDSHIGSRDKC